MLMMPIPNFYGYYACDDGQIWSTSSNKFLHPCAARGGYHQVSLCRGNRVHNKTVHRAVAEAFLPNPERKITVNHKNSIRTDNRLCNLEWATHSENSKHGFKMGRSHPMRKLSDEAVLAIRRDRASTAKDLGKKYGVHAWTIHKIREGKVWKKLRT